MRDLNKVMIIGRLGRDPEMRYTPSGHPRTKFSVATGRHWTTQDGEKHSETEWFNVVTWDRLAEICNQYLSKGQRVYIEGRMQTRKWDDANGNRRYATEVIANEMLILSEKRDSSTHEDGALSEDAFEDMDLGTPSDEDDECPF